MTLTILGASGRTGQELVRAALAAGYQVRALVRNPDKLGLSHDNLQVLQGDALDPNAVDAAIKGADAVLNALGHTKNSPDDLQTRAIEHVLASMARHNVKRLISLIGADVRFPNDRPRPIDNAVKFLLGVIAGRVLKDGERHVALIKQSDLDWTVVRAPWLTNSPKVGSYRVGYLGRDSGARISRADLADFMLSQVSDTRYLHDAPVVSA